MATSNVPIFPQAITNAGKQFNNATSTTITTLFTAGTNGSCIEFLNCATTDTAANNVTFYLNDGTTSYTLGVVQVPATSGTLYNIPAVSIFASANISSLTYDANGNKVLMLASGWSLQASVLAAVTSGKTLNFTMQIANW